MVPGRLKGKQSDNQDPKVANQPAKAPAGLRPREGIPFVAFRLRKLKCAAPGLGGRTEEASEMKNLQRK